jgi:ABC-2 type transport system ATP-binding protein
MMMKNNFPELKVENFSKKYGSGKNVFTACKNISFTVNTGSVTGLIGPNGAGKTTLLKAICGILYPSEGSILLKIDENLAGQKNDLEFLRYNTGFVPETAELDLNMSTKEILYFHASMFFPEKSIINRNIEKVVNLCSLEDVFYKKVRELSKGFKQRLSLAKAIVQDPKVLVLDEFSGGLDPSQIIQIRKLIENLSHTKTVILSTHLLSDVKEICSNLLVLSHGSLKFEGSAEELVSLTNTKSLEEGFLKLTEERSGSKE